MNMILVPRVCRPKKRYYVGLNRTRPHRDGSGWSNFIVTSSLAQARRYAKKLPRKYRQIDVREWGKKKPYVLEGSWL